MHSTKLRARRSDNLSWHRLNNDSSVDSDIFVPLHILQFLSPT